MVLPEDFKENKWSLSDWTDRFLAFLIDLTLVVPIISILLSPLVRFLQIQYTFSPESAELSVLIVYTVICYGMLFFLYHFLSANFWGKTFGQSVLGLKVASIENAPSATGVRIFLRSFVFVFSVFCLGIPFLTIFLHRKKMALHDLISETAVFTKKKQQSLLPSFLEKQVSQNLLWTIGILFTFWIGLQMAGVYKRVTTGELKRVSLEQDGYLCNWDADESANRMDQAIALFLGAAMPRECLEKEADFALWTLSEEQKSWGYLAKSFLSEDEKTRTQYQELVCAQKEDTEACQILRNQESSKSMTRIAQSGFEALKLGDTKLMEKVLNELSERKILPLMRKKISVHLLWMQDQKQKAIGYYEGSVSNFDEDEQANLSTWMCFEELEQACSSQKRASCEKLSELKLKHFNGSTDVANAESMTAMIWDFQCRGEALPGVQPQNVGLLQLQKLSKLVQEKPFQASRHLSQNSWKFSENLRLRFLAKALQNTKAGIERSALLALVPEKAADKWLAAKLKIKGNQMSIAESNPIRIPASKVQNDIEELSK